MSEWHINGGNPLRGEIKIAGAKNVIVKAMIAGMLTDDEVRLSNVPMVRDVDTTSAVIRHLGGQVEKDGPNSIRLRATALARNDIPVELAKATRASTMFAGPLLARGGEASISLPGGDPIGDRPLGWHFDGLRQLGACVEQHHDTVLLQARRLQGAHYRFPKNTHTGTETLIMAAVLADGLTTLENAAQEPEVDNLILMLNRMGARIERTHPRSINIQGVDRLNGVDFGIMPDRNEQVSVSCMALATRGDLWLEQAQPEQLTAFLDLLRKMDAGIEVRDTALHVWYHTPLQAQNVTTSPHPGFMTDWQPSMTTLLTQAHGTSVVHETVFERRFDYLDEIHQMGARIEQFNPQVQRPEEVYNFELKSNPGRYGHAVRVHGPTQLHGIRVVVRDVRAGAGLMQSALMAQGKTSILGVEHIERGYENLVERLSELGADIRKISGPRLESVI